MSDWKVVYTRQALKDRERAYEAGFRDRIKPLLALLRRNPFEKYPPFEKLIGDLNGAYSRRINRQHRLVYQVYEKEHIVKIISLWAHYE